jgi:hypothetical protein
LTAIPPRLSRLITSECVAMRRKDLECQWQARTAWFLRAERGTTRRPSEEAPFPVENSAETHEEECAAHCLPARECEP